jgi:hypothetical protein
MHGEPRAKKSWAALDIAIALATGTPAFSLDRFKVAQPVPVLYLSQEDSRYLVRVRAKALLRGRGINQFPDTLAFSVHQNVDLESAEWLPRLIRDTIQHGFKLVAFDPIRRFSANADKGPSEVAAITSYLRRLTIETGASASVVHHDVKPPANGKDERRRSHRASGGDWFASAECPITFEAAGETGSLVYPEQYKVSQDPQPFSFRLETDDPKAPTIAKLIGEATTAENAQALTLDQRVIRYVKENPGQPQNSVQRGVKVNAKDLADSLARQNAAGTLDMVKDGQKHRWFPAKKARNGE